MKLCKNVNFCLILDVCELPNTILDAKTIATDAGPSRTIQKEKLHNLESCHSTYIDYIIIIWKCQIVDNFVCFSTSKHSSLDAKSIATNIPNFMNYIKRKTS